MSQGTRSKGAVPSKRTESPTYDDSEEPDSTDNPGRAQQNQSSQVLSGTLILQHSYGYLYPIPTSTKSPQIASFQSGLHYHLKYFTMHQTYQCGLRNFLLKHS